MALTVRVLLIVVGSAVNLGLAVLGWGGLGAFFSDPLLIARIRTEEQLRREQLGGEYEAYCARTSRLIPRLY